MKNAKFGLLEKPSKEVILNYVKRFDDDGLYKIGESVINNLIKLYPQNNDIEAILTKIIIINVIYNTQIRAFSSQIKMAHHIKNLEIDNKLNINDPVIINDIANLSGVRNFYSFATKYCSFHKPDQYPIYDSYVSKMLMAYEKQDKFCENFSENDLRDYKKFKSIVDKFKDFYQLINLNYKQIDKFLYLRGKEIF